MKSSNLIIIAVIIILVSLTGIVFIVNSVIENKQKMDSELDAKLEELGYESGDQLVQCVNGDIEVIKPNSTMVCGEFYSMQPLPNPEIMVGGFAQ